LKIALLKPLDGTLKQRIKNGYKIIPVNPQAKEIVEEVSYPNLSSIPEPVDVVGHLPPL
jgi:predicted CoA-binding protein